MLSEMSRIWWSIVLVLVNLGVLHDSNIWLLCSIQAYPHQQRWWVGILEDFYLIYYFLPDSTKEHLVHHHENQVCSGGHDLSDISIGSNVTFLDHRTGEWYPVKVQSQESHSYTLTTEEGHTISHNHIDIRPTNVSFNLQTTGVKRNFPVSTKELQSKSPILPPVSQPQPKPNVAKLVKIIPHQWQGILLQLTQVV